MRLIAAARQALKALSERGGLLESSRARRVGTMLAVAAFASGAALSLAAHPDLFDRLQMLSWLLVLACVPLTISVNAAQFCITSRLLNARFAFLPDAVLVTILSTAANMLPLPGGSLVRIGALKRSSNTYGQAVLVTVLTGGCWVGVTATLAGCALLALGFQRFGSICLAVGSVGIAVALAALRRRLGVAYSLLGSLLALQVMAVAVGATRLWLCFRAIGAPVEPLAAATLTLSTSIAALVGFAPAGLGVTESLAAGISVAIGIPASFGFLAAALNRLSGLAVVGPLALLVSHIESSVRTASAWPRSRASRD